MYELNVLIFLKMNTWLFETCRRHYNLIKLLMKKVCILFVLITCLYHNAQFKKRKIHTDIRNDVCNEYVSCVVVVGEWNVIMERRWKDTDKIEQISLRETHLSVILSTMNYTLT